MKWFYADQGQQIGPIEDADLDRLLNEGKIKPETLVWYEGLANWQPLSQARAAAQSGTQPAAPQPGGSRCASCGKLFPPSELISIGGRDICGTCKPAFVQRMQEGAALPDSGEERDGPAWEKRETLGLMPAIVETVKGVLMQPAETFAKMKREGGLRAPLIYNILIGSAGGIVGALYRLIIQSLHLMPQATKASPIALGAMTTGMLIGLMIFMPVLIALGSFVSAGITHLCLMMLGGAKRPFETTFRVVCYASGSAAVLQVVPVCGAMVYGIWNIVSESIGLAKAHEISTGKAVAAVLLPMIVCCGLVMVVAFAAIGVAAGMSRH